PTLPATNALPALPTTNPDEPAHLRIVQANPGLELVDIYLDFSVVAPRFRLGSYSNRPVEVPSGVLTLRVMPAGTPVGDTESLFTRQLELLPFQNLVLYFYGTADSILLELYEVDLSPLAVNTSRLYTIHAIPNGPAVNVLLNGSPIAQELVYGEQAGPEEADSGNYTIEINTGSNRILTTLEQELKEREVYTLLLTGDITTNTYEVIVFSEPANPLTLTRLVHASFDTPPVRIFLDGDLLVENFEYLAFTPDFLELDSGRHTLRVEAMDTAEPPLLETTLILNPNQQVNLVLYDRFIDLKVGQFEFDTEPVILNQARLTVLHMVPAVPIVTASIPTVITSDAESDKRFVVRFGETMLPQAVGIGAQTYQFFTGSAESPVLLSQSEELMIEAGNSYTYILTGRRGEDGLLLAVPVGETRPETAAEDTEASLRVVNALDESVDIVINDEVMQEDLPAGEISDPLPFVGETRLEIRGSFLRLEETLLSSIENEQLTVFAAGEALYRFTASEEVFFEGRARLRFFSALTTTVYPLLIPADEDTRLRMGIQPGDNELVRVGQNPFEPGRVEVLDMPPGNYTLQIIDLEGNVLHEESLSIVANLFYEMVLQEGISVLKIPVE
ncbi:MAG: DUF4397 domain-containing protein, partial [Anaerolineae bacterium]|nr:DUF4397 domain-containing protein [Anaerolineae bacterium]